MKFLEDSRRFFKVTSDEILGKNPGKFPGKNHEEICRVFPRGISAIILREIPGVILEKIS